MAREEIVVGLDIGTTKVGTVIATGDSSGNGNGTLTVTGVGVVPSRGIKRGVIVDVADTVAAIQESVERAAHMAGVKAEGAVAGITGDHIQSSNRRGIVTVASRSGNINRFDIERVMQAAALEIPRDREIIHSLARDFIVDGHAGVKRPVGMAGQRLEVETHIVTGKASFLQNAVQCVEKAGLSVEALVLEPIATAEAVTTSDERDMGVILIDIGGGTSDIAVFENGSIIYSGVLSVGGNHVTRDIAIGLRTPFEVAETIKIDSGAALPDLIPHGEALEVTMAGSGEKLRIPRSLLGEIIEARMSELCEMARSMMHEAGVQKRLPAGVILTGGGALLPGAVDLANEVFQMPVRLGFPLGVEGWSEQVAVPQFATGVGLCRFALKQRSAPGNQTEMPAIASSAGRRIWGALTPAPVVRTFPRDTGRDSNRDLGQEASRGVDVFAATSDSTPATSDNLTGEHVNAEKAGTSPLDEVASSNSAAASEKPSPRAAFSSTIAASAGSPAATDAAGNTKTASGASGAGASGDDSGAQKTKKEAPLSAAASTVPGFEAPRFEARHAETRAASLNRPLNAPEVGENAVGEHAVGDGTGSDSGSAGSRRDETRGARDTTSDAGRKSELDAEREARGALFRQAELNLPLSRPQGSFLERAWRSLKTFLGYD